MTISGISPISGSLNGNTKITITGKNLNIKNAYVYIGDKMNQCKVIEPSTSTSLVCVTSRYIVGKHKVFIGVRENSMATCLDSTNNCEFFYDAVGGPLITDSAIYYTNKQDDILTFTGTNLVHDDVKTNVLTNAVLILNNDILIYSTSISKT